MSTPREREIGVGTCKGTGVDTYRVIGVDTVLGQGGTYGQTD